jgi:hypothetical protein
MRIIISLFITTIFLVTARPQENEKELKSCIEVLNQGYE